MSAKQDPEEDYDENDEEEDDDEPDFVPGADDDDEDDGAAIDDDDDVLILDGTLSIISSTADSKTKLSLSYVGDGFHLQSSDEIPFNFLESSPDSGDDAKKAATTTNTSQEIQLTWQGPCDPPSTAKGGKPTPRSFALTIKRTTDPAVAAAGKSPGKTAGLKSTGDDDDVKGPPPSTQLWEVYANQISTDTTGGGGERMEFRGTLDAATSSKGSSNSDTVNLVCQVRLSAAAPVVTVAAAAVARPARKNNDDDEEDEYEQEQVEYDELIALHEDAGLSVEDLRKRYHGETTTASASAAAAGAPPAKKHKFDDDDDDDDDIGF